MPRNAAAKKFPGLLFNVFGTVDKWNVGHVMEALVLAGADLNLTPNAESLNQIMQARSIMSAPSESKATKLPAEKAAGLLPAPGKHHGVKTESIRHAVIRVMTAAGKPMKSAELREAFKAEGRATISIASTLTQLAEEKSVKKVGGGYWQPTEKGKNTYPTMSLETAGDEDVSEAPPATERSGKTGLEIVQQLVAKRGKGGEITAKELKVSFASNGLKENSASPIIYKVMQAGMLAKTDKLGTYKVVRAA